MRERLKHRGQRHIIDRIEIVPPRRVRPLRRQAGREDAVVRLGQRRVRVAKKTFERRLRCLEEQQVRDARERLRTTAGVDDPRRTTLIARPEKRADSVPPAPGKRPALVPAPDSAKAAMAQLDSTLRKQTKADSGAKKPSRPPLYERLVVRLSESLAPGGKYAVEVRGVRNVSGATGDSKAGFTVPERPRIPADTAKIKAEKGDTAPNAGRPDSSFVEPRAPAPQKR